MKLEWLAALPVLAFGTRILKWWLRFVVGRPRLLECPPELQITINRDKNNWCMCASGPGYHDWEAWSMEWTSSRSPSVRAVRLARNRLIGRYLLVQQPVAPDSPAERSA